MFQGYVRFFARLSLVSLSLALLIGILPLTAQASTTAHTTANAATVPSDPVDQAFAEDLLSKNNGALALVPDVTTPSDDDGYFSIPTNIWWEITLADPKTKKGQPERLFLADKNGSDANGPDVANGKIFQQLVPGQFPIIVGDWSYTSDNQLALDFTDPQGTSQGAYSVECTAMVPPNSSSANGSCKGPTGEQIALWSANVSGQQDQLAIAPA